MSVTFSEVIVWNFAASSGDLDLAVSVPSGTTDGDLLLATITLDGTNYYSAPSGWTSVFTNGNNLQAWYKIASSESGTYTFTASTGAPIGNLVVCRFSGDGATAVGSTATGSTCPNANVTVDGSMVAWVGYAYGGAIQFNRGTEVYDLESAVAVRQTISLETITGTGNQTGAVGTDADNVASIVISPASTGPSIPVIMNYLRQMVN
jgi:hypothetical protein